VPRFPVSWPLASVALLLACSSNPQPGAPAPSDAAAPASSAALTGDWDVRIVSTQGTSYNSQLRLSPRGGSFTGTMQPLREGERVYFVRGATLTGLQVVITLEAEDGEIRITGVLRPGNQLDGSYTSRTITGRLGAQRR
jgi:hypothetical protein